MIKLLNRIECSLEASTVEDGLMLNPIPNWGEED